MPWSLMHFSKSPFFINVIPNGILKMIVGNDQVNKRLEDINLSKSCLTFSFEVKFKLKKYSHIHY